MVIADGKQEAAEQRLDASDELASEEIKRRDRGDTEDQRG
jgi:hypothetical protein